MTNLYYENGPDVKVGDKFKKSIMTTKGGPITGQGKVVDKIIRFGTDTFVANGKFKTIDSFGFTGETNIDFISLYDAEYDNRKRKYILKGYKKVK